MSEVEGKRRGRIDIRVDERQDRLLRAAAELTGETLTGFVLAVATAQAEQVLDRAHRVDLDAEAFARFLAALDRPVSEMPTIRRYAARPSSIPER
jgi:uncharacterized protein (DUF1778 family)